MHGYFVHGYRSAAAEPEAARQVIAQESTLLDFCEGCKIGCPYEVSAFTNSPMLALESGPNFLRLI